MLRRLDLGGTACYEDTLAVGISLDGSMSDDEVTPVVIGDYNHCPFPNDTFDAALGSCYLEDDYDFKELYRVLKSGAEVRVMSCGMLIDFNSPINLAKEAGFELVEPCTITFYKDEQYFDITDPYVFRKP